MAPGVEPHIRLPAQWKLAWTFSPFAPSPALAHVCACSFFLSQINKYIFFEDTARKH